MSGYSLGGYGEMIADRQRTDAYLDALRRSIRPGCTVIEIGTGIGFFALMARRFGAGTVYAIEQDRSIEVARQIARANNVDGIHFIEDVSTHVDLPCRADVVFSDLRGVLPLFRQHIPAIADARRRLLAIGGTLIPRFETIWASPVDAAEIYSRMIDPWGEDLCELDMSAARSLLINGWQKARVDPAQLLARPSQWAQIDYTTVEDPDVRGPLRWSIERAGVAHGICVWFDTILAPGVGFSNAPEQPEAIYGSAFFPFSEPLTVETGDFIDVDLRADLVGDDYVWSWSTWFGPTVGEGRSEQRFAQSSFFASPLSPGFLGRRASDHKPALIQEGRVARLVLDLVDGNRTHQEIAEALAAAWPADFADSGQALQRVIEVSERYNR